MKAIYTIVGMKHRPGAERLVASMKTGEPLRLVRDPFNTHDRNAVEVWASGVHIGFVKGSEVAVLAARMDRAGCDLEGRFVTENRWPAVEVDE